MTHSARVLVSGYFGFGNAGDEAILAGLIAGFQRLSSGAELAVLSGNPAATRSEHGVPAIGRGLLNAYRWSRRSRILVSGGGGLLQDVTSWRSPVYYLSVIRAGRSAGIPVAVIGHGIGPLRRRSVRALARRTLSQVDVLAVRDPASLDALRDLGVTREVEVTADLAFLLPRPTEDDVAAAWRLAGLDREGPPTAAVALRPLPGRARDEDLCSRLGAAVGGACGGLGLRPILVPMRPAEDLAFSRRVARAMPGQAAIVAPPMSARQLLGLIGGCRLVVAMRLHALIYAAICSVAPVAVSYDPKVDALMDQLGLGVAAAAHPLDAEALSEGIGIAWRSARETSGLLPGRAERLRSAAARNIELTLPLLGDNA